MVGLISEFCVVYMPHDLPPLSFILISSEVFVNYFFIYIVMFIYVCYAMLSYTIN